MCHLDEGKKCFKQLEASNLLLLLDVLMKNVVDLNESIIRGQLIAEAIEFKFDLTKQVKKRLDPRMQH